MFTSFENGTGYLLARKLLKFGFEVKVEEMFMYLRAFYENCLHMSQFVILLTGNTYHLSFLPADHHVNCSLGSSHLMHTTPNKHVLHEKTLFHI